MFGYNYGVLIRKCLFHIADGDQRKIGCCDCLSENGVFKINQESTWNKGLLGTRSRIVEASSALGSVANPGLRLLLLARCCREGGRRSGECSSVIVLEWVKSTLR